MAVEKRDTCVCDQCGYIWLVTEKHKREGLPLECANKACKTRFWNAGQRLCKRCGKQLQGGQRLYCSRQCKNLNHSDQQRGKQPVWIAQQGSGHHPLCACIVCLAAICEQGKQSQGHRGNYGVRRGTKYGSGNASGTKRGAAGSGLRCPSLRGVARTLSV